MYLQVGIATSHFRRIHQNVPFWNESENPKLSHYKIKNFPEEILEREKNIASRNRTDDTIQVTRLDYETLQKREIEEPILNRIKDNDPWFSY